ncbi:hypothetical protein [Caulobacter sp. DWP3-1-3b2]|uniref:hypothetical protein n=1 Tax=Caulobacter sp. DWP3-1-3b2 TaxID=2804643 RepID=UPI003CEA23D6
MNRTTPKLRIYAERLIAYEMGQNAYSQSKPTAGFVVIETLNPHFGALMGAAGFRALISRALVLASAEVAWLSDLNVKADCSFEGLNQVEAQANPEEIATGGLVLLARLLGLLVTLIGENLTLQLLNNVNGFQLVPED